MQVFSNHYLMRDICGINCNFSNEKCAMEELWYVLKLRIQPDQSVPHWVFVACAHHGNIQFAEWLTANRAQGWPDVIGWAAKSGHFDMVKWLFENRKEACEQCEMDYAARGGNLDIVKWMYENMVQNKSLRGNVCAESAIASAAEYGHFEIMDWLFKRTKVSDTFFKDLINNNYNQKVVKWVLENDPELQ